MRHLLWILFIVFSTALSAQMEVDGEILYGNEWIDYDKTYVKVTVNQDGIYRIFREDLIANGIPLNQINLENLEMYYLGSSVGFFADPGGAYIEFYGKRNRSELDRFIYENEASVLNTEFSVVSDESAYFITWSDDVNPLLIPQVTTDLSSVTMTPESSYLHKEWVVRNEVQYKPVEDGNSVRYSNFIPSEGFGSGLRNKNTINIPISEVADNGGTAKVIVRFGGNNYPHNTSISINEEVFETFSNSKSTIYEKEYEVSLDMMESSNLKLQLEGNISPDSDKSMVAFGRVEYPRQFVLNSDTTFTFYFKPSSTDRYIEIEGYGIADLPVIYDLETATRIIPELTSEGKIGLIIPASTNEKEIFLSSQDHGIKAPLTLKQREFVLYDNPDYNYIMITHESLRNQNGIDWVQEYADYRASTTGGSYIPLVVNVDQLYDQYAYGIDRHFISLRNFGFWTKETYTNPKFMFIVGKGIEYRENRSEFQLQFNNYALVPTWGNPGADNLILSNDSVPMPIYPIGRLAAKTPDDVKDYLDKIKQHDDNNLRPQTIEERLWLKRVMHLSGGDINLQETLANNLMVMADTLSSNLFGAEVTTFYKKSVDAIEIATSDQIFDLIHDGLSMITFFGHSSPGKFDFNIDNIDLYENKGKYPMVFSLGCHSGNIHFPDEGISEQFVVSKERGAISFIAASGTAYVGQQNQYGLRFYERMGKEDYGKPLGDIMSNVISEFLTNTSFTYVTFLQQLTMHGDPALRLAAFDSPDLVPDATSIKTNPTFVDTYEKDFEVCFDVANIGSAERGDYDILIEHFTPTGELTLDTIIRVPIPVFVDNYCVKLPITSNKLVGRNLIKVTVDHSNEVDEMPSPDGELNNKLLNINGTEGFEFYILNNSAIPIYPKEFSINNEPDVSLVASTYNAFGDDQKFIIQIDTTANFDSQALKENLVNNVKGVVEWNLDFQLLPKTVYYWRISPDSTSTGVGAVWSESSFVNDQSARDGWNQSHYYQYLTDDFENMFVREDRRFSFAKNLTEIVIENRIRIPGVAPPQFLINNNAWSEAMEWRQGPLLSVTAVDTLGKFFYNDALGNDEGEYGSINPYTVPIITFHFKADDPQSRLDLLNLLENVIPDKHYVFFYPVFRNANSDFKVEEWAADSIANNGVNIVNFLEDQGSLEIRDIQDQGYMLPYGFVYQKGVSPLAEGTADSIQGVIQVKEEVPGFWYEGRMSSDFIGPANSWDEVEWAVNPNSVMSGDTAVVRVYGYDINQSNETMLFDNVENKNLDISSIQASQYPFIKLEYYANDFNDVSPVQLQSLRVYYEGYGDLAVNTTRNYSFYADSLQQGDNVKLVYDISNFSTETMPPSEVEYTIIDEENKSFTERRDLPELKKGETKTVDFSYNTRQLLGKYQFRLELNPDHAPIEDYYFNNFGLGEFKVTPDRINPLLDVTFDGVVIMDQDIVSSKPLISIELRDENEFILLENPENFNLALQYPNGDLQQILVNDPAIDFYPAQEGEDNKSRIEFNPELVEDGEYTLTVAARDESSNASGDKNYEVRFRVFNEEMVSNVFNYPNPFSTSTQFIFTLTGSEEPGNVLIRIMTLSGKVVREITAAELGPLRIGMNRTEYKWDGRDEFGDKLGNGTYLYQVITKKLDGSDYKHFSDPTQNNTDYLFKKGFGKLVIIR